MKREFVKTSNHQRFEHAILLREQRGASESGLVVVHGRAGEGKTRTMHNWASKRRGVMLTAYPGWTPHRAMKEIAALLKMPTRGDEWEKAIEERVAAEELPIVVDEAGFALADSAACVERLRSITDKSGTLLVMAFMRQDMGRLHRYQQLTSRATLCEFLPSAAGDVAAACEQLAEVAIAPDLVQRIFTESEGRMRLVMDAINLVEHVASAARTDKMALADMKGMRLCQDFDTALAAAADRGSRHRRRSA